jgi:hypothetical protein
MAKPIRDFFERRYRNNNWAGRDKGKVIRRTNQMPKRMYRPKKPERLDKPHELTEADFDALVVPPEDRKKYLKEKERANNYLSGIELIHRHRYGSDVDILRSTFTRTKEEVEKEKFSLILACRELYKVSFFALKDIPKHEKYVMGGEIRKILYQLLSNSIAIKRRYYRRNLLEEMDINLDIIRELLRLAHIQYPSWMTDEQMNTVWEKVNDVGAIVGGLLKTSVC